MATAVKVWEWIFAHWASISALVAAAGASVIWYWRNRESRAKAKREELALYREALALQTKGLSQSLYLAAAEHKRAYQQRGVKNPVFSEDELRSYMREEDAPRLHAVLDLLRTEGKIEKGISGMWKIY